MTSLRKLVERDDPDESLRHRWEKSALSDLVPLRAPVTWKGVPQAEREPYALLDAIAHRVVGEDLRAEAHARGLDEVYRLDMAALPMLVRMEQVGMACDGARLEGLAETFGREYDEICERIFQLTGEHVEPNHHEEVSELLFDTLEVTPTRPTKTGYLTTQDKYLKARKHEHEVIPEILLGRHVDKLRGTYAAKLPKLLRDGRYYPDWRYTRTVSGRLAEPIIVLIPKHTKRGLLIRNCFYAIAGHLLVLVDLSQIEMRAMAHLSRDEVLLGVYARGEDVHASTAHHLLGAPAGKENQDESLHRLPSKTINFGIINGMTEYGLLDQLHENGLLDWTLDAVREFRTEWFKLHKGVDAYWKGQIELATRQGYVTDLFGRRRRMDAIWSTDERIRRQAEREALFPIQSTADGISKIWNARIWTEIVQPMRARGRRYCEPWVRVHDETALEVDARSAQQVCARMLQLVPDVLDVPTTAEGVVEQAWGDHKLKKVAA